jgi:hypothetical protein
MRGERVCTAGALGKLERRGLVERRRCEVGHGGQESERRKRRGRVLMKTATAIVYIDQDEIDVLGRG